MATQSSVSIRQFYLIYQKLTQSLHCPSAQDILEHLARNDIDISKRTLQRNFDTFRNEFGVEVTYDYYRNGYFIDKANSRHDIDRVFNYLSFMYQSKVFYDNLRDSKNALNYIQFEFDGLLSGVEYLDPVMQAIKKQQVLQLSYQKHQKQEAKQYLLHPHLLREYQGRWYVIGYEEQAANNRIFGIDRIQSLTKLERNFAQKEQQSTHTLFQNLIGLNYSENEPQQVILKIHPNQAGYVRSLPFHSSQVELDDSEDWLTIQLYLIPNFEFKQKLWMLGARVQVIEPAWLAADIKEELERALGLYG